MRIGDLLRAEVVDAGGTSLGHVRDVRLVQDGRPLGTDAALRVHGLIVGPGAVATRLGYGHAGVRGPWLLRVLLERRAGWYVPWTSVTIGDDGRLRLDVTADQLAPPLPLPDLRGRPS